MEVILLKHMDHLGRRGDLVRVAPGYARNYLLPRKMAVLATAGARRLVEQESRKFEALDQRAREDAAAIVEQLSKLDLSVAVKADEDEKLYGSVSVHDIQKLLAERGLELERKQIVLEQPIKTLGTFEIPIKLHMDVRGSLTIKVVQE